LPSKVTVARPFVEHDPVGPHAGERGLRGETRHLTARTELDRAIQAIQAVKIEKRFTLAPVRRSMASSRRWGEAAMEFRFTRSLVEPGLRFHRKLFASQARAQGGAKGVVGTGDEERGTTVRPRRRYCPGWRLSPPTAQP
jgi:hypothetical protein